MEAPAEIVQRQLDCYNRRELDAFCECFADDATIHELGASSPTQSGKPAIRARYRELFDRSPALHARLVGRISLGRVVADHELVTGRLGSPETFEVLALYEVEGGLIRRVHFARP